MSHNGKSRRVRRFVNLGAAALLGIGIGACGGGGSGDGGSSAAAAPMRFSDAPPLNPAPTPLPQSAGGFNICENVRFGGRDIENLEVPDGRKCVLESGVEIDGNVELGTGSEFYAQGVRVGGNVQGQRAATVVIENATIGGNVQLDIGGTVTLRTNTVDGNLQCKQNQPAPTGGGNRVQGNKEDQCAML